MATTPPAPDFSAQWKAFSPDQRTKALSRMSPQQKQKLATSLGYKSEPAAAAGPAPAFSANPPSKTPVQDWFHNAETDLREGGSRTGVGRVLGKMQGNSGKYTGLQAGTTPAVADFMGSVPLGAMQTGAGLAKMSDHPVSGAVDAAKGVAHMAEMPGMFMGGPGTKAVEAVPKGIAKVLEAVPGATRGAKQLSSVEEAAGHLPISLTRTDEPLAEAARMAENGFRLPYAIKKLLSRYVSGEPIDYSDARQLYSNITELTAEDQQAIKPAMRRQLVLITQALKDDIGTTAAQVDKAADYYKGMKNYARGMKAQRIGKILRDALTSKTAKIAMGGAAGYGVAKAIGKEF